MLVEVRDNGQPLGAVAIWKRVKFRVVMRIVRLMIEWSRDRWNRIYTHREKLHRAWILVGLYRYTVHLSRPDKRESELWDPPMGVCSQDPPTIPLSKLIFSYGLFAIGAIHISRNYRMEFAIWYLRWEVTRIQKDQMRSCTKFIYHIIHT